MRTASTTPRRRGATIAEFALVGPIFFLLLFGVIEYARFVFAVQLVNNAAREGARYAATNSATGTKAQVQSYVDQYMSGQGALVLSSYNYSNNVKVFQADPVTGADNLGTWNAGGRTNP